MRKPIVEVGLSVFMMVNAVYEHDERWRPYVYD